VAVITTPACTGSYVATAVLYAAHTIVADADGVYTFTEPGTDSALYVYAGDFDPALPAANCVAATNTNPLSVTATLTKGSVYHVVVIEDTFAQDGMDFAVTIAGPGTVSNCAFLDLFEDGTVGLSVLGDAVTEEGGDLVLAPTAGSKTAEAVADGFAGCSTCAITTVARMSAGTGGKFSILGWYADARSHVELQFDERKDRIVLRQKSRGRTVRTAKATAVTIDPETDYEVLVSFDGTAFVVWVDGIPRIVMETKVAPTGVPGFRAKKAGARVGFVCAG
jgi:hypothetical protein